METKPTTADIARQATIDRFAENTKLLAKNHAEKQVVAELQGQKARAKRLAARHYSNYAGKA